MILIRLAAQITAPLAYLAVIAVCAALLAYAISLVPYGDLNFSLLVTRGAQFVLLISLLPLARNLRLSAGAVGFPVSLAKLLPQLASGFVCGVLILSLHVALLLGLGAIKPNPDIQVSVAEIASILLKVIWVGFLVATIEELIFRGVSLAALRRMGNSWAAAVVTASYYALLHFVKSDIRPSRADIQWTSGFEILADGAQHMLHDAPIDSLLALFCAGLFLAAVRLVFPRTIALCIGIHAGWVVVIKIARRLTNPDPHAPLAYLVGPYDQIIGYGAAVWISLLLVMLLAARHRLHRYTREFTANG